MSRGRHVHAATVISLALFSVISFATTSIQGAEVYLSWNAPEMDAEDISVSNPIGYKVYYGLSRQSYEFSADVGNVLSTILGGLEEGHTYYVTIVAYNHAGVESDYSNEASFLISGGSPTPAGLVAAYSFDEGTGAIAADASGHGNDGLISGAIWTSASQFGNALYFDGLAAHVALEDAPSLRFADGMTISAWVYPTALQSGWGTIVQKDVQAYYLYESWDGDVLNLADDGTLDAMDTAITMPEAIPANVWSHFALTYDGVMLRFYLNGEEIGSIPQMGRLEADVTPLQIGGNALDGEYFEGYIDEVRLYNRPLSPSEIQAGMHAPIN